MNSVLNCIRTPLNKLIPYLKMQDEKPCDCDCDCDCDNGNDCDCGPVVALQASSSSSQTPDTTDAVLVEMDTIDLSKGGLTMVNSEAIIPEGEAGTYVIVAAAQVGAPTEGGPGNGNAVALHLWLEKDGADIPNSNVLFDVTKFTKDPLITEVLEDFEAGEKVTVMMSIDNDTKGVGLEASEPESEPHIPGITFTMYKVK